MIRHVVIFQPEGRRVDLGAGEDLLDAALRCGAGLEDLCAGRGTCGKCRVLVRRGAELLSAPTPSERRSLGEPRGHQKVRLACQARPAAGGTFVLEIPPEAQRGWQRLQTSGTVPRHRLDPAVRELPLRRGATVAGLRARGLRVPSGRATLALFLQGPGRGPRNLIVRGHEILTVSAPNEPLLGMAFDIGSTKIAGFLVDLSDGAVLATVSAPNPQLVHGEDIMSRLAFALEERSQEAVLHREVVGCVNRLVREACDRAHRPTDRVYEITAVGNTAMQHLLLGLPVDRLARAPYAPASRREVVRSAAALGLSAAPSSVVVAPPVVGAFVGSDLVAGVVATRMDRSHGLRVLIDVGTNTEVCAGNREGLVACSSPSGPAFEGAHIRFGMRAADGAVERASVEPETWHVDYRTIGRKKPRGLCGSALLDLLAGLFRAGAIDSVGRLRSSSGSNRIRRVSGQTAFRVVPAEETSIGEDIVLTQNDIGQLQLAKAAIHGGIDVLLDELGRDPSEIRTLYLAGAFGSFLAPESARTVGMFPNVSLDRIRFVGNTAGSGARLALVSLTERARMRNLARTIRHVSLAGDPRFSRAFATSLALPHRDPSRFSNVPRPGRPR
jgi:uncharacterized 2Fe-2S/4Fe-4S cluster protein (DUF4445 family)